MDGVAGEAASFVTVSRAVVAVFPTVFPTVVPRDPARRFNDAVKEPAGGCADGSVSQSPNATSCDSCERVPELMPELMHELMPELMHGNSAGDAAVGALRLEVARVTARGRGTGTTVGESIVVNGIVVVERDGVARRGKPTAAQMLRATTDAHEAKRVFRTS